MSRYLGYPDQLDNDLVAYYWYPGDFTFDDGMVAGSAARWFPFRAFMDHPLVYPQLSKYFLGADDGEAEHWLLLDRQARKFWVGTPKEVAAALRNQHGIQPPTKPLEVNMEDLEKVCRDLAGFMEVECPSKDEITARIQHENELLEGFQAWLKNLTDSNPKQ